MIEPGGGCGWITRHGFHHGYFMPRPDPAQAAFSFAGVGRRGPTDVAVGLFTFTSYEHSFLRPLYPAASSGRGPAWSGAGKLAVVAGSASAL